MSQTMGIGFPNRLDSATISTSLDWASATPASRLLTPNITDVARSVDEGCYVCFDLGAAYSLQCFSLVNHNIKAVGEWKVDLGTTALGTDVYAGTYTAIGQMTVHGITLEWPDADLGSAYDAIMCLSAAYSARYVTFYLRDIVSTTPILQVGRMFAGPMWSPNFNADYGLKDYITDFSTKTRAESATKWRNKRRRVRGVKFGLTSLTHAEAEWIHEFQMSAGTVEEVLYIPNVNDMAYTQRYGFTGLMEALSEIDYPNFAQRGTGFEIQALT